MRTALIGHTGFVGSNLAAAYTFTDSFNTSNIADLRGRSYDLVVSAASRADSHRINQHATEDLADIDAYLDVLTSVRTSRLVLISTVCVYPGGITPDETSELSAEGLTPYGANRLHMEQVLARHFDTLALRLPQLYGRNLKKGIVFDLLNDYRVEHIQPEVSFQYYDLGRLWSDIGVALSAGLSALNLATPPLSNARVAAEVFRVDLPPPPGAAQPPGAGSYTRDMRTVHAAPFGGPPGYLMDQAAELDALRAFVRRWRTVAASSDSPR
ncbi:MAG: NAD-dependent epimerase/dehydratase family protein [bacterium]